MSLSADNLIDRIRLKENVVKWRNLAILFATLLAATITFKSAGISSQEKEYIARVSINGIILEDRERQNSILKLKDNKNVKAVLFYINSPGGTMVGGESLYNTIKEVSNHKPTASVMGSVAASGGYMAAIGAEKIFAHSGTITGSIGVMLQTFEATELAKKIGINFTTFKSSELKGSPSPFEKSNPRVSRAINSTIQDSYEIFLDMIEKSRPLSRKEIIKLADGRVYTGRQAERNRLIDSLGGEKSALEWFFNERSVNKDLKVIDIKTKKEKDILSKLFKVMSLDLSPLNNASGGIMVIEPSLR